jgi:hypothetical protein
MAKCVVLWTNHKQTTIVSITDGVEKILHVESKANEGVKRQSKHDLNGYYRKVIRAIQDAQGIFIFGTAQAKMELKVAILKVGALSHRVVGTETADAMTENQLVARASEMSRLQGA